jgi:hypothetical protein
MAQGAPDAVFCKKQRGEQMKALFQDLRHVWIVALSCWCQRRHNRRGCNPDFLPF